MEVVIVNFLELSEVRIDLFIVFVGYLDPCVFKHPGKMSVRGCYFSTIPGSKKGVVVKGYVAVVKVDGDEVVFFFSENSSVVPSIH